MDEHALRELDAAMIRLADGDRSACSSVFGLLWPELVSFAERTLGKSADADDAAQQAIEKVFAQAADYDARRPALPWALAIVAWECKTALRRRMRRREEPIEEERLPSVAVDPESIQLDASALAALRAGLAGLSASDRLILEQAFFMEREAPQPAAFRKRKERALSRLRSAWRKFHGD